MFIEKLFQTLITLYNYPPIFGNMEKHVKNEGVKFVFDMGGVQLTPAQCKVIEARINAIVMEEIAKIDNSSVVGIVSASSLLQHKSEIDAKLGDRGSIGDFVSKYGGDLLNVAAINAEALRGMKDVR